MSNISKKELYELIKTDESIFDFIQENALDCIWYWDLDNPEKEWMNPNLWAVLGYNPDEMPHKTNPWQNIINQDDLQLAIDNFSKHDQNQNHPCNQIVRYQHKDGSTVWIQYHIIAIRDENGTPIKNIGAYHDITNERQLESKLERVNEELLIAKEKVEASERKYLDLFMSMPNGFSIQKMIVDDNGVPIDYIVTEANKAYEVQSGIKVDTILNKRIKEVFPQVPEEFVKLAGEVALTGKATKTESYSDVLDMHFIVSLFQPTQGYFATVFYDITAIKKAEKVLIQAKEQAEESNRLITVFINNMSHEIRTPMNGIMGFSELLGEPNLSTDEINIYTKTIQKSCQRLLRTMDDILEISLLETNQVKLNEAKFALNDLLMELYLVFRPKSQEKNISLHLSEELQKEESFIISDKAKLHTILRNLLENAVKFTHIGSIEFGYYIESTNLVLFVKDTGIGIAPEYHKTIFQRFSQEEKELTRKFDGLGLGLAISKDIAELLGGSITLKSERGKGTAFYVKIPYKHVQN